MIKKYDNIFDTECEVLVNPVNCVGVMGAGLAKQFAIRYPAMLTQYKELCSAGQLRPGQLWLYDSQEVTILSFPTKTHWVGKSKIEYIELGLQKFVANYERFQIRSIAFPLLGCGHGGLHRDVVLPLMEGYLGALPITVEVYAGGFGREEC